MASPSFDEVDGDEEVCLVCGGTPCEWCEFGMKAAEMMDVQFSKACVNGVMVYTRLMDNVEVGPNVIRKAIYKAFVYQKYGHLGKGNRIPIPDCVVNEIRKLYPDKSYMGFKEQNDALQA